MHRRIPVSFVRGAAASHRHVAKSPRAGAVDVPSPGIWIAGAGPAALRHVACDDALRVAPHRSPARRVVLPLDRLPAPEVLRLLVAVLQVPAPPAVGTGRRGLRARLWGDFSEDTVRVSLQPAQPLSRRLTVAAHRLVDECHVRGPRVAQAALIRRDLGEREREVCFVRVQVQRKGWRCAEQQDESEVLHGSLLDQIARARCFR